MRFLCDEMLVRLARLLPAAGYDTYLATGDRPATPWSLTVAPCPAKSLRTFGETWMRKLIVLSAAAAALLVASCNTVEGVGKDVSAAGHAVAKTADDAKH
jgi:predicted small secreted protein